MMGLYVRLLESHEYARDEYFRNRETGLRARLKLLWDIFRILKGLYIHCAIVVVINTNVFACRTLARSNQQLETIFSVNFVQVTNDFFLETISQINV